MLSMYTETLFSVHGLSIVHYEGTFIRTFDSTSEGTHINDLYRTHECITRHIYEWPDTASKGIMPHMSKSCVAHMNASCRIYASESVISHIWRSTNESHHAHGWVMSHIWMSRVAYMNKSRGIYEWVMSQMWMRHVTYIWVRWNAARKGMCLFVYVCVWHYQLLVYHEI